MKCYHLFLGVGYAAAIINLLVGLYYNVIIAYCLYYLTVSFRVELPWKNCHNEPNCFVRENLSEDCRTIRKNLLLKNSKYSLKKYAFIGIISKYKRKLVISHLTKEDFDRFWS